MDLNQNERKIVTFKFVFDLNITLSMDIIPMDIIELITFYWVKDYVYFTSLILRAYIFSSFSSCTSLHGALIPLAILYLVKFVNDELPIHIQYSIINIITRHKSIVMVISCSINISHAVSFSLSPPSLHPHNEYVY